MNELDVRPFCVYMHTVPNGKIYIGLTKLRPEKRWQNGHGYKQNIPFYKDIQKYGWTNIKHDIIADRLSVGEACALESQLIQEYDSCNPDKGYNHADGGGYKFVVNGCENQTKEILDLKAQLEEAIREKDSIIQKYEQIYIKARSKYEIEKENSDYHKEREDFYRESQSRYFAVYMEIVDLNSKIMAENKELLSRLKEYEQLENDIADEFAKSSIFDLIKARSEARKYLREVKT